MPSRHEDPRSRRRPRRTDALGIPYIRPEIALLFMAKGVRAKDEADFTAALPLLGDEQRRWLVDALVLVHPGHRWLPALVSG